MVNGTSSGADGAEFTESVDAVSTGVAAGASDGTQSDVPSDKVDVNVAGVTETAGVGRTGGACAISSNTSAAVTGGSAGDIVAMCCCRLWMRLKPVTLVHIDVDSKIVPGTRLSTISRRSAGKGQRVLEGNSAVHSIEAQVRCCSQWQGA
jgi:hypothetical protein